MDISAQQRPIRFATLAARPVVFIKPAHAAAEKHRHNRRIISNRRQFNWLRNGLRICAIMTGSSRRELAPMRRVSGEKIVII